MLVRKTVFLFFAMSLMIFSAEGALACSCQPSPTVDIMFDKTTTVAIFRVKSVEQATEEEKHKYFIAIKSANLVVEKVFKGDLRPGEEFTFSNVGICLLTFESNDVGDQYLLYLD